MKNSRPTGDSTDKKVRSQKSREEKPKEPYSRKSRNKPYEREEGAKRVRKDHAVRNSRGQAKKAVTQKPEPKTAVNDGTTRLNKYIANAGICSRRDADKLIEAGAVSVNGEVVTTLGYKVKEGDIVAYGGEILRSETKRYFLLNKPKGYITTVDDPQERNTSAYILLVGSTKTLQGCCFSPTMEIWQKSSHTHRRRCIKSTRLNVTRMSAERICDRCLKASNLKTDSFRLMMYSIRAMGRTDMLWEWHSTQAKTG